MPRFALTKGVHPHRSALSQLHLLPNSRWAGDLMEVQEIERRRISQELHDDLGQRLALFEIQIDQLEQKCAVPEVARGLKTLLERVAEMDRDLHRICYRLHPVVLEKLGLVIALESFCREFSEWSGVRTEFVHKNFPGSVPNNVSLCLYRIVQEALHNVSKHAGAEKAIVSLRRTAGSVEVVVADSGIGFDPALARRKGGLGLISIEERARRAGGQSSILTRPGFGTEIRAILPVCLGESG